MDDTADVKDLAGGIEKLSVEEIVNLHNKIVVRIRELYKAQVSKELQKFQVGEIICFENEGNTITGTVIRINQKTLSIKTKEGCWYIDPKNVTKFIDTNKNYMVK